jgi:hypothetical protein
MCNLVSGLASGTVKEILSSEKRERRDSPWTLSYLVRTVGKETKRCKKGESGEEEKKGERKEGRKEKGESSTYLDSSKTRRSEKIYPPFLIPIKELNFLKILRNFHSYQQQR